MQRIALTQAKPGMVLAQAVCRQDGPILAGAGLPLSDGVIDRIRQAGVGSVWVEGNPLGGEGGVDNLRKTAESLPYLFRRHKDNVFMMTLCTVFGRHFSRRMAEQQALEDAAIAAAQSGDSTESGGES